MKFRLLGFSRTWASSKALWGPALVTTFFSFLNSFTYLFRAVLGFHGCSGFLYAREQGLPCSLSVQASRPGARAPGLRSLRFTGSVVAGAPEHRLSHCDAGPSRSTARGLFPPGGRIHVRYTRRWRLYHRATREVLVTNFCTADYFKTHQLKAKPFLSHTVSESGIREQLFRAFLAQSASWGGSQGCSDLKAWPELEDPLPRWLPWLWASHHTGFSTGFSPRGSWVTQSERVIQQRER